MPPFCMHNSRNSDVWSARHFSMLGFTRPFPRLLCPILCCYVSASNTSPTYEAGCKIGLARINIAHENADATHALLSPVIILVTPGLQLPFLPTSANLSHILLELTRYTSTTGGTDMSGAGHFSRTGLDGTQLEDEAANRSSATPPHSSTASAKNSL